jgi:hypothetical protein
LPPPLTQGELEGLGVRLFRSAVGNSICHPLVSPIDILLGDVVKGDEAVVVFEVVESPVLPGL